MASKKRKKKKSKGRGVKITVQGRRFTGKHKFKKVSAGYFAYRGYVYRADEFDLHSINNMEQSDIEPVGKYIPKTGKKKRRKQEPPRDLRAWLYTNGDQLDDVKKLLSALTGD